MVTMCKPNLESNPHRRVLTWCVASVPFRFYLPVFVNNLITALLLARIIYLH